MKQISWLVSETWICCLCKLGRRSWRNFCNGRQRRKGKRCFIWWIVCIINGTDRDRWKGLRLLGVVMRKL
jgi:hypothetical protein